jgi:predicted transglutaminase-like cysteine proteinase
MAKAKTLAGIILAAVALQANVAAEASTTTDLIHLHAGNASSIPKGWSQFCRDLPAECRNTRSADTVKRMDAAAWRELGEINRRFNRQIVPMTDEEQYGVDERWTYASSGKGDCEDYVLEKRRELIRRGWPMSALLITVVIDKNGGGHAVLTVVSDKGEYVLDNQIDEVLPWSRTGLTFVRRQSPEDQNVWQDLGRVVGLPDVVTTSSKLRR